jgi:hypothetical protein
MEESRRVFTSPGMGALAKTMMQQSEFFMVVSIEIVKEYNE